MDRLNISHDLFIQYQVSYCQINFQLSLQVAPVIVLIMKGHEIQTDIIEDQTGLTEMLHFR